MKYFQSVVPACTRNFKYLCDFVHRRHRTQGNSQLQQVFWKHEQNIPGMRSPLHPSSVVSLCVPLHASHVVTCCTLAVREWGARQ